MSQENVEVLRQANAAFNRGDIEGFLELAAEEIEIEDSKPAPDVPPVVTGKDAVRAWLTAWTEAFSGGFTGEIVEYLDLDDHHVACVVRYSGKEPRSGMEVDFKSVDIWEIRGGKLLRGRVSFPDRESALRSMGLSEQDAHADS
jgi:ketosteroid isomerase-like protein